MIQVLIMGDSWAVPEYSTTFKNNLPSQNAASKPRPWLDALPNYSGDCHIEHYLRNLGYDVYNSGHGGISNVQSIRNAISTIKKNNLKPDYIIWFHTALFRDFRHFQTKISLLKSYEQVVNDLAEVVYEEMAKFIKSYNNPKIIAIGGQAPIVRDVFDKHIKAFFCINDWRSEILKEQLPEFQVYGSENMLSSWNWSSKEMDRLAFISDLYRDKMTATSNSSGVDDPLFPDCCHPGRTPHYELTEKLHMVISKYSDISSHDYIKKPGTAL